MKTGLFLAALVQLAAAQPHRNRHEHLHGKRDIVTDVQVVTQTAPDVVVYVNQYGTPISTSTITELPGKPHPHTHTLPAPVAAAATPAEHHKHGHKHNKEPAPAAPAPAAAPAAAAAPAPAPAHKAPKGGANSPLGIAYSPYNADGSCKTQDQVNSDFDIISGYDIVRMYGTDCDQVTTIGNAAAAHGMKVFAGVFDLSDIVGDVQLIVQGFQNNWEAVHTVSIGNELVNSGLASVAEVVAALNIARPILQLAGFQGSVVTVDTFNAIIANPELCQASDYAAANAHAFFDPSCPASNAGQWTTATAADVKNACGKAVVITEAGWPHAGIPNGAAVPGPSEQATAISQLKSDFADGGLFIFTAFDDLWKVNTPSTFDAEQSWGIYPGQ